MKSEYNTFPPGWREISEKEFAKSAYFSEVPAMRETRQMIESGTKDPAKLFLQNGQPVYMSAVLYHYGDKTGVAIFGDYWSGKVRYFKFGCNHAYRDLQRDEASRLGSFGPSLVCTKCDLVVGRRDSSG